MFLELTWMREITLVLISRITIVRGSINQVKALRLSRSGCVCGFESVFNITTDQASIQQFSSISIKFNQ